MKLNWKRLGYGEDAILGDFDGGDGVRFSLVHMPTCHRRGPWRLLIEVAKAQGGEICKEIPSRFRAAAAAAPWRGGK